MIIFNVKDKSFNDVTLPSIVLMKAFENQYHTGLLYKDHDGNKILHLAWHRNMQSISPTDEYIWTEIQAEPLTSRQISAACRLIWKEERKSSIPYGFGSPIFVFDSRTGEYIVKDINIGLTCSSFVLAILSFIGFDLIDYNSWPTDYKEAKEWQVKMISLLSQSPRKEKEHIDILEKQVGNTRYLPQQVFASASSPPMGYDKANELSLKVIKVIEKWDFELKSNNSQN